MTWIVSRPTGTKKGHREIIQATFFLKVFLFLGKSRCVTNEKKKRNWENSVTPLKRRQKNVAFHV